MWADANDNLERARESLCEAELRGEGERRLAVLRLRVLAAERDFREADEREMRASAARANNYGYW